MLRITVELVPFGNEKSKRTIAVHEIANDGTGTNQVGNYMGRKNTSHGWSDFPQWTPNMVVNHVRSDPVERLLAKYFESYCAK